MVQMADRRIIILLLVIFVAEVCSFGNPDRILDVKINCPATASGTAELNITSDRPVRVTLECVNKATFEAQQIPNQLGEYNASIYFSGNSSEVCLFWKMDNSNTYRISVRVTDVEFVEDDEHKFYPMCTYNKHKAGVQSVEEMSRSLVPSRQLETHLGYTANSTFTIEVQDILGRVIEGKIPYKKTIRLVIRMTSGSDEEQGLTVKHCDASNDKSMNYRFLTSGCGDGHVLDGDKGFTTNGLVASSPYFQSFLLHGSKSVSFECTFSTCKKACDGTSCNRLFRGGRRKRRRTKRDGRSVEAITNEDQHIKTAAFVIAHQIIKNKKIQKINPVSSQKSPAITLLDDKYDWQHGKLKDLPSNQQTEQSPSKIHGQIFKSLAIPTHVKHTKNAQKYFPLTTPKQSQEVTRIHPSSPIKELNIKSNTAAGKVEYGLTYEQKAALVGCIMFLVMIGVFVSISFYYTRQKNNFEKKFWTIRAADNHGGSRTYLLDDVE